MMKGACSRRYTTHGLRRLPGPIIVKGKRPYRPCPARGNDSRIARVKVTEQAAGAACLDAGGRGYPLLSSLNAHRACLGRASRVSTCAPIRSRTPPLTRAYTRDDGIRRFRAANISSSHRESRFCRAAGEVGAAVSHWCCVVCDIRSRPEGERSGTRAGTG